VDLHATSQAAGVAASIEESAGMRMACAVKRKNTSGA
jgi:hypothetical protein